MTIYPEIPPDLAALPIGAFCWHNHHRILCEPLTEPAPTRWAYIIAIKPVEEIAIRLRLFRPVRGALPAELVRAHAELDRAYDELDRARAELDRAYADWDRANSAWGRASADWDRAHAEWNRVRAAAMPALSALHAIECAACPWDGQTIFPEVSG